MNQIYRLKELCSQSPFKNQSGNEVNERNIFNKNEINSESCDEQPTNFNAENYIFPSITNDDAEISTKITETKPKQMNDFKEVDMKIFLKTISTSSKQNDVRKGRARKSRKLKHRNSVAFKISKICNIRGHICKISPAKKKSKSTKLKDVKIVNQILGLHADCSEKNQICIWKKNEINFERNVNRAALCFNSQTYNCSLQFPKYKLEAYSVTHQLKCKELEEKHFKKACLVYDTNSESDCYVNENNLKTEESVIYHSKISLNEWETSDCETYKGQNSRSCLRISENFVNSIPKLNDRQFESPKAERNTYPFKSRNCEVYIISTKFKDLCTNNRKLYQNTVFSKKNDMYTNSTNAGPVKTSAFDKNEANYKVSRIFGFHSIFKSSQSTNYDHETSIKTEESNFTTLHDFKNISKKSYLCYNLHTTNSDKFLNTKCNIKEKACCPKNESRKEKGDAHENGFRYSIFSNNNEKFNKKGTTTNNTEDTNQRIRFSNETKEIYIQKGQTRDHSTKKDVYFSNNIKTCGGSTCKVHATKCPNVHASRPMKNHYYLNEEQNRLFMLNRNKHPCHKKNQKPPCVPKPNKTCTCPCGASGVVSKTMDCPCKAGLTKESPFFFLVKDCHCLPRPQDETTQTSCSCNELNCKCTSPKYNLTTSHTESNCGCKDNNRPSSPGDCQCKKNKSMQMESQECSVNQKQHGSKYITIRYDLIGKLESGGKYIIPIKPNEIRSLIDRVSDLEDCCCVPEVNRCQCEIDGKKPALLYLELVKKDDVNPDNNCVEIAKEPCTKIETPQNCSCISETSGHIPRTRGKEQRRREMYLPENDVNVDLKNVWVQHKKQEHYIHRDAMSSCDCKINATQQQPHREDISTGNYQNSGSSTDVVLLLKSESLNSTNVFSCEDMKNQTEKKSNKSKCPIKGQEGNCMSVNVSGKCSCVKKCSPEPKTNSSCPKKRQQKACSKIQPPPEYIKPPCDHAQFKHSSKENCACKSKELDNEGTDDCTQTEPQDSCDCSTLENKRIENVNSEKQEKCKCKESADKCTTTLNENRNDNCDCCCKVCKCSCKNKTKEKPQMKDTYTSCDKKATTKKCCHKQEKNEIGTQNENVLILTEKNYMSSEKIATPTEKTVIPAETNVTSKDKIVMPQGKSVNIKEKHAIPKDTYIIPNDKNENLTSKVINVFGDVKLEELYNERSTSTSTLLYKSDSPLFSHAHELYDTEKLHSSVSYTITAEDYNKLMQQPITCSCPPKVFGAVKSGSISSFHTKLQDCFESNIGRRNRDQCHSVSPADAAYRKKKLKCEIFYNPNIITRKTEEYMWSFKHNEVQTNESQRKTKFKELKSKVGQKINKCLCPSKENGTYLVKENNTKWKKNKTCFKAKACCRFGKPCKCECCRCIKKKHNKIKMLKSKNVPRLNAYASYFKSYKEKAIKSEYFHDVNDTSLSTEHCISLLKPFQIYSKKEQSNSNLKRLEIIKSKEIDQYINSSQINEMSMFKENQNNCEKLNEKEQNIKYLWTKDLIPTFNVNEPCISEEKEIKSEKLNDFNSKSFEIQKYICNGEPFTIKNLMKLKLTNINGPSENNDQLFDYSKANKMYLTIDEKLIQQKWSQQKTTTIKEESYFLPYKMCKQRFETSMSKIDETKFKNGILCTSSTKFFGLESLQTKIGTGLSLNKQARRMKTTDPNPKIQSSGWQYVSKSEKRQINCFPTISSKDDQIEPTEEETTESKKKHPSIKIEKTYKRTDPFGGFSLNKQANRCKLNFTDSSTKNDVIQEPFQKANRETIEHTLKFLNKSGDEMRNTVSETEQQRLKKLSKIAEKCIFSFTGVSKNKQGKCSKVSHATKRRDSISSYTNAYNAKNIQTIKISNPHTGTSCSREIWEPEPSNPSITQKLIKYFFRDKSVLKKLNSRNSSKLRTKCFCERCLYLDSTNSIISTIHSELDNTAGTLYESSALDKLLKIRKLKSKCSNARH